MADLGYVINHAMFQRNGRSGYVLKPLALRSHDKSLLNKRTRHCLDITVRHPLPSLILRNRVDVCVFR
jgi:hypothetical protein